jgi:Mrp family chromosome partitioning ATPase
LSLIENSLEKLRRAALAAKEPRVAAAGVSTATRVEPITALEPRFVHRRIAVDMGRLRAEGYLPEEGQERRFADYCHRIKRPVIDRALAAGAAQDARIILFTSALPGDGKTFITLNVALSMARERDVSVLLVEGICRGRTSVMCSACGEPGLLNAPERVGYRVGGTGYRYSGLEFLPGAPSEGAAELIASVRMREIASRLICRNPRRLVLFDSPPLVVSSEARALMQIPGQIILVARAGHTPRQAIVEALTQVDKSRLIGLVLNDGHVSSEPGYYDYGYGSHDKSG